MIILLSRQSMLEIVVAFFFCAICGKKIELTSILKISVFHYSNATFKIFPFSNRPPSLQINKSPFLEKQMPSGNRN